MKEEQTKEEQPINRPQLKMPVGISSADRETGQIVFDMDISLFNKANIKEFGIVHYLNGNRYSLIVDSRYLFNDVLSWLKSLG